MGVIHRCIKCGVTKETETNKIPFSWAEVELIDRQGWDDIPEQERFIVTYKFPLCFACSWETQKFVGLRK